ncbi:hypothetical protein LWM68_19515 [Niabella sp. W65]|nr:hypothetical protein [Niabella sp. W65]MCH7364756.1 hypothetical protein [Niabella sp. W65]
MSLCIDHENNLWIGSYLGGLDKFDGNRFTHFTHRENDPSSISNNSIWEIFEDREHNLWIGTLGSGLDRFDKRTNSFEHYKINKNGQPLLANFISAILQDKKGNIWIGAENGLTVFNTRSSYNATYTAIPGKKD